MTEALRDQNHIPTLLALSNADGETILPVYGNATNNALAADDDTGGSDLSGDIEERDQNRVPVFMAVSAVDGVTPVPIYLDPTGNKLLINSN